MRRGPLPRRRPAIRDRKGRRRTPRTTAAKTRNHAAADDAERAVPAVAASAGSDRGPAAQPGERARTLHLLPAAARPATRRDERPANLPDRPRPGADRGQLRRRLRQPGRKIRPAHPPAGLPRAATRRRQLTLGAIGRIRRRPALPQRQRERRTQHPHAERPRCQGRRISPRHPHLGAGDVPRLRYRPALLGHRHARAGRRRRQAVVSRQAPRRGPPGHRGLGARSGGDDGTEKPATSAAPTTGCFRSTSPPANSASSAASCSPH